MHVNWPNECHVLFLLSANRLWCMGALSNLETNSNRNFFFNSTRNEQFVCIKIAFCRLPLIIVYMTNKIKCYRQKESRWQPFFAEFGTDLSMENFVETLYERILYMFDISMLSYVDSMCNAHSQCWKYKALWFFLYHVNKANKSVIFSIFMSDWKVRIQVDIDILRTTEGKIKILYQNSCRKIPKISILRATQKSWMVFFFLERYLCDYFLFGSSCAMRAYFETYDGNEATTQQWHFYALICILNGVLFCLLRTVIFSEKVIAS